MGIERCGRGPCGRGPCGHGPCGRGPCGRGPCGGNPGNPHPADLLTHKVKELPWFTTSSRFIGQIDYRLKG